VNDFRLLSTSPYITHAVKAVAARCQERGMSRVAILTDMHLPGNGWRLEPTNGEGYAVGPDLETALLAELRRQGLVR